MTRSAHRSREHPAFALGAVVVTVAAGLSLIGAVAVAIGVGVRYGPPWSAAVDWPCAARIKSGAIKESSGLVASRRYPGVFWTHNDSGNGPDLFAIRADGSVLRRFRIHGIENVDWEDIAIDDAGHLYVGDIGDNFGRHESRTIYKIDEPDPMAEKKIVPAGVEAITFRYADNRSDCEALFHHGGRLYVITKHFFGSATLFRVGEAADGGATLEAVCRLPLSAVTAADVSADGKRLAVLGYGYLAVFDIGGDLANLAKTTPKKVTFPAQYQTEACAFDGEDLLITAESREIWRVRAEDIEKQRSLPTEN
jgi:hypothetical protein